MPIEYKTTIVIVAFFVLISLEHLKPAVINTQAPLKRILKNLSFWPVNIALSALIILPISYVATEYSFWSRPASFQGTWSIFLDLLILDIFIYWWHKTVHQVQFLWRFHEVHRLDEHLDTTSAIRFHFGEIFFSSIARGLLIWCLDIPFSSVVLFETLVLIFTFFHHSNIAIHPRLEKWLSKIIVTPSIHWVHHHAIRGDTDSNYCTILSFWDTLFSSRSTTNRTPNMKIGVEHLKDRHFWALLRQPFTVTKESQE